MTDKKATEPRGIPDFEGSDEVVTWTPPEPSGVEGDAEKRDRLGKELDAQEQAKHEAYRIALRDFHQWLADKMYEFRHGNVVKVLEEVEKVLDTYHFTGDSEQDKAFRGLWVTVKGALRDAKEGPTCPGCGVPREIHGDEDCGDGSPF